MNNFIQLSKNFGTNSKQLGLLEQFYVGAGSERELVYGERERNINGALAWAVERLSGAHVYRAENVAERCSASLTCSGLE